MRVALAQALFCKPDLLLLDEPTNMLDIQAVIWLEKYLQGWASILILVSHDRHFLDKVATDILHLHEKRIHKFQGNYTDYLEAASDLDNMKYKDQMQDFIRKWGGHNEKKIRARVETAVKTLANLPVLETTKVRIQFPEVDRLKGN